MTQPYEGFAMTLVLTAVRIAATLRLLPFFGGGPMPVLPWLALSTALSLLLAPLIAPPTSPPITSVSIAASVIGEVFIGVVIGLLCRMAFSVLEMVGSIARATAAPVANNGEQFGLTSFYALTGAAVFILIGGHHGLISTLLASFTCVPIGVLPAPSAGLPSVPALFATAMGAAALVALPIFAAGLFADAVVGGLGRLLSVPPIHGATSFRSVAALLAAFLSLGAAVSVTLELLQSEMEKITVCGRP